MTYNTNENNLWSLSGIDLRFRDERKPEVDIYYDCDCVVDLNDLMHLTLYQLERSEINETVYLEH